MAEKKEKNIVQQIEGIKKAFKGFSRKWNRRSIGIDVGSKSVKIVELERKKGKIRLKNYAFARTEEKLLKIGVSGIVSEVTGQLVKKTLIESGIKAKNINVAVPGFTSLITTIEIPRMKMNDIDRVIRAEAPKYIPLKLDEVVYGWQIISGKPLSSGIGGKKDEKEEKEEKEEKIRILVVAIMKDISRQYQKVFATQKLNIASLEIDSFSLIRSLIGNDPGCYLVLDIGYRVSNMIVANNRNILINRTVDVAGNRINTVIEKSLNVDSHRAEQLKIQRGVNVGSQAETGGMLEPTLGLIVDEVERTLSSFADSYPDIKPKQIVITGGCARMIGFREYIEKKHGDENNCW